MDEQRNGQPGLEGQVAMALREHRGRLMTIQELLVVQRESSPAPCAHCGHDGHDDRHEVVAAALRRRIVLLEERVAKLEAWLGGMS